MRMVVALGQRLVDESLHPHLRRRVDLAIDVYRRAQREDDDPWLVFTGAATNPDVPLAESEAMGAYATDRGVDPDRIRLDTNARDTRENGYFVRRIADDVAPDEGTSPDVISVVSSCVHLERAAYVFEQCFGPDHEIDTTECVPDEASDPGVASTREGVAADLEADREFFASMTPGNLDEFHDRFLQSDEYPDWATRVDRPTN